MPGENARESATKGMVTSPHHLATEAGAEIIRAGGTAIEAAIAVGSVLTVVTPHFCGLGGDAVWLVADERGRSQCFLGIGQAGQHASAPPYAAIPTRGPASMLTTACVVDSWDHALRFSAAQWNSQNSLSALLEHAQHLATSGFKPSASQAFWLDYRADETKGWPGFLEAFDHRAKASDIGCFKQPELADCLQHIRTNGARSFYEGKLAYRLVAGMEAVGGCLTLNDLSATRTREVNPITLEYRGVTLVAPPPPTQGITTLAIMGILRHFDLQKASMGTSQRYHLLVEAVKRAFLDRRHVADPAHMKLATDALLADEHLNTSAGQIDPLRALPWPQPYQHGDTVFFSAVDQQGRCASVLQSTYFDWGSGVVVGDTGILWQNRGAAFTTASDDANCLAPGKLPFYTLNPGIALKNKRPFLTYGTQGADGQPQTLAVILAALLDDGLEPSEALAQARFLLGRTFSDSRDSLKVEGSMSMECQDRLHAIGHELSPLPAFSPIFGQAGVLLFDPARKPQAAHDPRGEGTAWVGC